MHPVLSLKLQEETKDRTRQVGPSFLCENVMQNTILHKV